jgi:hypothetical protein
MRDDPHLLRIGDHPPASRGNSRGIAGRFNNQHVNPPKSLDLAFLPVDRLRKRLMRMPAPFLVSSAGGQRDTY